MQFQANNEYTRQVSKLEKVKYLICQMRKKNNTHNLTIKSFRRTNENYFSCHGQTGKN